MNLALLFYIKCWDIFTPLHLYVDIQWTLISFLHNKVHVSTVPVLSSSDSRHINLFMYKWMHKISSSLFFLVSFVFQDMAQPNPSINVHIWVFVLCPKMLVLGCHLWTESRNALRYNFFFSFYGCTQKIWLVGTAGIVSVLWGSGDHGLN